MAYQSEITISEFSLIHYFKTNLNVLSPESTEFKAKFHCGFLSKIRKVFCKEKTV